MHNLHSNISQSLKFNILILLSLFGCYPVSHIIIGEVKTPINVADVKVYFDFPKNCEKIAIVEASSNFALKDPSFDFTHQNKTDKALNRLKEEAASIAVLAELSKTITLISLLYSLIDFSARLTGSFSNKVIIQLIIVSYF